MVTIRVLYTRIPSPLGNLLLTATGRGLSGLYMEGGRHAPEPASAWRADPARFRDTTRQLEEYFRGELQRFDLPLDLTGTPFELEVWEALRKIPYGQTISYGELARRIGRPGAARAVGAANGRNPIAIVIPCHRVVGANGALTGYGGGIDRKRALLDLEARVFGSALRLPF